MQCCFFIAFLGVKTNTVLSSLSAFRDYERCIADETVYRTMSRLLNI